MVDRKRGQRSCTQPRPSSTQCTQLVVDRHALTCTADRLASRPAARLSCLEKQRVAELAQKLGLPVPRRLASGARPF